MARKAASRKTASRPGTRSRAASPAPKGNPKGRKKGPKAKTTSAKTRPAAKAARRKATSTVPARKKKAVKAAPPARRKAARPAAASKRRAAPAPAPKAAKAKVTTAKAKPRAKATPAPKARRVQTRARREGGTGRERDLAQTPETGRTVQGPTNPMPTKRSTGTPAGAGTSREAPGLDRARRQLRELEETVPSPPSSLNLERRPSAARTGRQEMREARLDHNEVSPEITAGDVDADWEDAYATGDEAPGGDNPTPDQDRVDDIGKALGVVYEDNEELKGADKITERDEHRWELDPASSEDYPDRDID